MITVGVSQDNDSAKAGQLAARAAAQQMAQNDSPGWAMAFCGGRQDSEAVLQGLRSELGQIPVVGGAGIGTITNDSFGYSGFECAVAVFPSSLGQPQIVSAPGLDAGEVQVGQQLGEELSDIAQNGETVLLFYDSLRSSGPPPVLNEASRLMEGVRQGLVDKDLNIIGAGTIGDYQFTSSFVFDGSAPAQNTVVAVVLPSALQGNSTIMHGCVPISSFLKITRIEGPVVYEIDGRPALDVILGLFDEEKAAEVIDLVSLTVALGHKHGDPYAPYDESVYVNRLIVGADPENGSVTLFESDFSDGTAIQIMSRDNHLMLQSVRERTEEALASLGAAEPVFAFYIDCAGRTCYFCGADVEDASVVQEVLGEDIPLLGFYSGVEIAPLLSRSQPLEWTGVLTLFTLRE